MDYQARTQLSFNNQHLYRSVKANALLRSVNNPVYMHELISSLVCITTLLPVVLFLVAFIVG